MIRIILISLFSLAVGSCANVNEKHIFATHVEPTVENPSGLVNIFRIRVFGFTTLANSRYIAGSYDERAVDFFLNEVKSQNYAPSNGQSGVGKIFKIDCEEVEKSISEGQEGASSEVSNNCPNGSLRFLPNGNQTFGGRNAFVIILSTNANAIAETIGAIAENSVAIQSVNFLLNRDTFEQDKVLSVVSPLRATERQAVLATLEQSFDQLASAESENSNAEIAILQTLAVALRPNSAVNFDDVIGARAWFANVQ